MAEERLQRRLAAILSADVVGYSRLMGIDEAGTLARLKAMRRRPWSLSSWKAGRRKSTAPGADTKRALNARTARSASSSCACG
jgi:hypothetical protein